MKYVQSDLRHWNNKVLGKSAIKKGGSFFKRHIKGSLWFIFLISRVVSWENIIISFLVLLLFSFFWNISPTPFTLKWWAAGTAVGCNVPDKSLHYSILLFFDVILYTFNHLECHESFHSFMFMDFGFKSNFIFLEESTRALQLNLLVEPRLIVWIVDCGASSDAWVD